MTSESILGGRGGSYMPNFIYFTRLPIYCKRNFLSQDVIHVPGGIAYAYYGCAPEHIEREVLSRLDDRLAGVVKEFMSRFF